MIAMEVQESAVGKRRLAGQTICASHLVKRRLAVHVRIPYCGTNMCKQTMV